MVICHVFLKYVYQRVFDNKKVIPKNMENVDLVGELVLKCFKDNGDIQDMMYPNMGEKEWQV